MKKSTKIVLITAAVLTAVGMILILISVALGGNKQYREYVRENGEYRSYCFRTARASPECRNRRAQYERGK